LNSKREIRSEKEEKRKKEHRVFRIRWQPRFSLNSKAKSEKKSLGLNDTS
jgi:hypothetical protein